MGRDVRPDGGEDAFPTATLAEVALEAVDAAGDRVDVGVLETRQEQPATEVDHARARPDVGSDVRRGSDRHDPLAANRDGLRAGARPVDRVNVAAGQDEVGGSLEAGHAGEDDSGRYRGAGRPGARDGPD